MKYFIFSIAISLTGLCNGQSIERQVMGSVGGSFGGAFQLDYTVGEVVVNTASAGSVILTQGFHQPPALPNIVKLLAAPANLKAYPIPSLNCINLNWMGDKPDFNLEMFNSSGALVYSGNWLSNGDFKIDVSRFSQGIYSLKFRSEEQIFSIQVSKI